jgi:hypothetical protein
VRAKWRTDDESERRTCLGSFYCDEHGAFRFLTRSGMVVRLSNTNEMSFVTIGTGVVGTPSAQQE